jgi:hypothetical protein
VSCTADQQQRFADGYFGYYGEPPGTHTFKEAMTGVGNDMDAGISRFAEGYAQGAAEYQATQPPQSRVGTILGPNGEVHTYTDFGNGHGFMTGADGVTSW